MKQTILVVDDDPSIVSMLKRSLLYEGYEVAVAFDGADALQQVAKGNIDLVILDITLPKQSGWEVCKSIRQQNLDIPILMLTAQDEVENRVKGLDLGADDYIVKPFALDELLARVRAQLRRFRAEAGEKRILQYEDVLVNLDQRQAWWKDHPIELKGKEFDLLALFLRHPHIVLSKIQIIEQVWGMDFEGESNVVEVYIANVRQKLEKQGAKRYIHTIRGIGYVLRGES